MNTEKINKFNDGDLVLVADGMNGMSSIWKVLYFYRYNTIYSCKEYWCESISGMMRCAQREDQMSLIGVNS